MKRTHVFTIMALVACIFLLVLIEAPAQPPAAEAEGGQTKQYVYKKTPQGELKIHVHLPPGWKPSDKRPGIVFFFGGGYRGGSIEHFLDQATYLAERGMVAARADYRVQSRHGVAPDKCVEDAKSAIRWFRAHAGELGVDPNRIVGAGGSAGGHIAACAATTEGLEAEGEDLSVSSRPNVLVLFNPVLSLVGREKLVERVGNDAELAARISPTVYLKKDTPPALLMYGTEDQFLDQAREFVAKSKKIGHRTDLYWAEGQFHAFFNHSPWMERTLRRADEFLASVGYLEGEATVQDGRWKDIRPPLTERQLRELKKKAEDRKAQMSAGK